MTTSEHADLIAGCSHDWGRTVDGNYPNCGAALASTPSPAQPTEAGDADLNCLSGEPCTADKPCVECRRGD